ncbi:MAG: hypothetical protein ABIG20_01665 [archaeon]
MGLVMLKVEAKTLEELEEIISSRIGRNEDILDYRIEKVEENSECEKDLAVN